MSRELLAELSYDEMRSVAGAATGTCTVQCDETMIDCEDFTHLCTALSLRLCVTGIG